MLSIIFSIFSIFTVFPVDSANVVGWFNGKLEDIPNIPLVYTHLVTGYPLQFPNGSVQCNKNDTLTQSIVQFAHTNDMKVQWRCSLPHFTNVIFNNTPAHQMIINNYLDTIPRAIKECGIDGIEIDYEWGDQSGIAKWGIINKTLANTYTLFLQKLKTALGPESVVSADIGSWNIPPQGYPLGFLPWVNATLLNEGAFDFVNTMSYHWDSVLQWEYDIFVMKFLWGFDLSRVNLGVPYFSMNISSLCPLHRSKPSWESMSYLCPNVNPNINICQGIQFVGKQMNYEIGKLAKKHGLGGLFPWTLNYDSFNDNNTLVTWLYHGFHD